MLSEPSPMRPVTKKGNSRSRPWLEPVRAVLDKDFEKDGKRAEEDFTDISADFRHIIHAIKEYFRGAR